MGVPLILDYPPDVVRIDIKFSHLCIDLYGITKYVSCPIVVSRSRIVFNLTSDVKTSSTASARSPDSMGTLHPLECEKILWNYKTSL